MAFVPRWREIFRANGLLMKWLNLIRGRRVVVSQQYVGIEGVNRGRSENPKWLEPIGLIGLQFPEVHIKRAIPRQQVEDVFNHTSAGRAYSHRGGLLYRAAIGCGGGGGVGCGCRGVNNGGGLGRWGTRRINA